MNTFFIKKGYIIRKKPEYYADTDIYSEWQPKVYDLAYFLGRKFEIKYIIDLGAGNGLKLRPFASAFKVIAVDYGSNLKLLKNNLKGQTILSCNFDKDFPNISEEILRESIVISADVIEHLVNPKKLLQYLSKISYISPFVLFSTPDRNLFRGKEHVGPSPNQAHVREWTLSEMEHLVHAFRFNTNLVGYTLSSLSLPGQKQTILVVSGQQMTQPISASLSHALLLADVEFGSKLKVLPFLKQCKMFAKRLTPTIVWNFFRSLKNGK